MENIKNRLYHYEQQAPAGAWDQISSALDEEKAIPVRGMRSRSKIIFYTTTAAAAITILLFSNVFNKKPESTTQETLSGAYLSNDTDSVNTNNLLLEKIINAPEDKKMLASHFKTDGFTKKYITIAGPNGEPVRISPKVATLILSADNEYPPKAVWNNKINKWKEIMLSNTLSPTSAGMMDIMQLAINNVE